MQLDCVPQHGRASGPAPGLPGLAARQAHRGLGYRDGGCSGTACLGLTKAQWCLINQTDFYNKTTGFVDEGRVVTVIYLNCRKAFNTASHNVLVSK